MFLTKGKRLPGIVHPGSGFQGQKNGRVVPPYGKDRGTGLGSVDCAGGSSLFRLKKNLTEVITGQSSMNIIWPNKRQGRTIRTQTPGGLGSLRPPGLDTLSPRLDWQPRALDTTQALFSAPSPCLALSVSHGGRRWLGRAQCIFPSPPHLFSQPALKGNINLWPLDCAGAGQQAACVQKIKPTQSSIREAGQNGCL